MDHVYSTTEITKKGSHLSYEERVIIEICLKDGSPDQIAETLQLPKEYVLEVLQSAEHTAEPEKTILPLHRQ